MKFVKALFALGGLLLLVFALFVFSGQFTKLFLKEEMASVAAVQKDVLAAEADLFAATGLKSTVNITISKSLNSDLVARSVEVKYEFIPPNTDRAALYRAAEAAVRKNMKDVGAFSVHQIPNPTPTTGPQRH